MRNNVSPKSDGSMTPPPEFSDEAVTSDPSDEAVTSYPRYRTMIETLNELSHLRDAGFGRPWPRHGLKLLYWFANECVSIGNDNVMLSECEPADGDFGFHCFENRYDDYGNKLLPDIDFPYYVVGNLNTRKYPGAEELPEYVSEDTYTGQLNSNTDRIIVSLYDEERFHRVYVTQHNDRSNYDPDATYRISRGLLMAIRRMNLQNFLEKMDYYSPKTPNTVSPDFIVVTPSSSDSDDSEPETQRNDTIIQFDDDTPSLNSSENLHIQKGFWESICTIL